MDQRLIAAIIPEYIVPVIKKDGIFQVYTECPTPYKGNRCIGIVQCLDGPPPEYKRVYRCAACKTEYEYDELTWRPATRAEIQAYMDYKRAWHKIQFDAYQMGWQRPPAENAKPEHRRLLWSRNPQVCGATGVI